MLRGGDLGKAENLLQMADAKRSLGQQMHDPQAGLVTQAVVDFDQAHVLVRNIPTHVYASIHQARGAILGVGPGKGYRA